MLVEADEDVDSGMFLVSVRVCCRRLVGVPFILGVLVMIVGVVVGVLLADALGVAFGGLVVDVVVVSVLVGGIVDGVVMDGL